ncbi:hypothetical protein COU54_05180 [Candidatus Pacearchaeota archaeon CG10_big_fil_rev_8_21_14_0_10_31_24]|nr:MAG: hypothetical protein COU54_05180 [Candidatus Pacearchaeota archaeon CG10_big_fil_rev_8_21_14_0_10_31_24]
MDLKNKRVYWILLFILIVGTIFYFLSSSLTGNVTFDLESVSADVFFNSGLNFNLEKGETISQSFVLKNNDNADGEVTIKVDDSISEFIYFEDPVSLKSYGSKTVDFLVNGVRSGRYEGNLYFISGDYNKTVPVYVMIKDDSQEALSLVVTIDGEKGKPGENLGFRLGAFNIGQLSRYNVILSYEIIDDQGKSVFQQGESVVIETALSLNRELLLPLKMESGEYELVVTASANEAFVTARDSFRVGNQLPLFLMTIKSYFRLFIVVFVITFVSLLGAYYLIFVRRILLKKKLAEKQKNSVYPFPDFDSLPQSGYASIGLVADTDEKTYLDYTQLNRHTLIAGGTGSGKTIAGMAIVEELLKKGLSVIVLDPIGQWTGFAKKNQDKVMLKKFKKFNMKNPHSYDPRVIEITDKTMGLDVVHYLGKKGMTILRLDNLTPKKADLFIESVLNQIYRAKLAETGSLKSLIVLDEVHRLLPKYGGKGAYRRLEQAVREFRKWGVGMLMISQVLTDFKGAIRGNIGTEIQMNSRYEGDIKRVRERHGKEISELISKMGIGLGMVESAGYNKGNPYFIEFRPLYHNPLKLNEKEILALAKREIPVLIAGSKDLDRSFEKESSNKESKNVDTMNGLKVRAHSKNAKFSLK